ncbi:MAG: S41 family peptidase [Spirochaetales bacterium]|nr:S41 family peptidase [Spirochaetales bacterium]
MERKVERRIWALSTIILSLLLALTLFSPRLFAESNGSGNSEKSVEQYMRELQYTFYLLMQNYVDETDPEVLYEGAMKGMLESLNDPYTVFVQDMFLQDLSDTTSGQFGGVGLYITTEVYDEENPRGRMNYVRVVSPIEGTPAYKAGIHAGDYIFEIDGETAEGFTSDEVSDLLRGKAGTVVNVTFLKEDGIKYSVDIKRAVIEIPTVKYDTIGEIGYLRIIEFTPYTADRFEEAVKSFLHDGCTSLIVDVRSNPGGLLESVVDVADNFFKDGTIVSTKSRLESENEVFEASRGILVPQEWPVAVLIDQGSASAAEILTGALKDRGRAVVLGETSFGKGSVQQFLRLGDNAIKMTTARYYTPSGVNIDKTGIEPDIKVEPHQLSDEEFEAYKKIIEEDRIGKFVRNQGTPTARAINAFIAGLNEEGLKLDEYYLKVLIQSEINRRLDNPPIYNLEYDDTLKRAVEELRK